MDDANKMQEKIFEELCEDIVNISRVLPSLTPLDLQTELLELRNDPDRVTTILRKHFKFYNEERENQMSQDIKMIKRVLPNIPIVQISKDLGDVGQKKNRVQLVLKKYFAEDVNPCKRPLDDMDSSLSIKVLKLDESVNNETSAVVTPECTSDHLLPPTSPIELEKDSNADIPGTSKSMITNICSLYSNENIPKDKPNSEENVSSTIETTIGREETISQDSTGLSNSVANEIVDSISKILSSDSNEEKTQDENNKTDNSSDERKTLFQIINNFYPDLTLEDMELILINLDINIYDYVEDTTLNVVLNEIMNYFENKEKFEHVKTKNENTNKLVETNRQSIETSSTEEYDFKDDLSGYFEHSEDINSTCAEVKQESPYQVDLSNYTDKNIGLLSKICQEIEDSSNNILSNEVFAGKTENITIPPKSFITIASGTDNWVKSAIVQSKLMNPNITSTSDIIKPAHPIKIENPEKRAVCSTITSASINTDPIANPFENNIDGAQTQVKQENVVNYTDYGLDLSHSTQDNLKPIIKLYKKNENWSIADRRVDKPVINIERPPRDNLKSSLSNNFGAGHSRTVPNIAPSSSYKNFVQYLETRKNLSTNSYTEDLNIDGLYLGNQQNFENPVYRVDEPNVPNPYLENINFQNRDLPTGNNNNLLEDKINMSKRSVLTKKEEKKVNALLCELGNGKCHACKKCLKSKIALKVRNDLFRMDTDTPDSLDSDEVVMVDEIEKRSPIPVVDISESSSSNSNPLPGTSTALQPNENHPFYYKIMEMFPDICPDYLRKICNGKDQSSKTLDYLISILLEGSYNRRERQASPAPALEFDEQYKTLLDLFPDADPTYLQHHCERLFEHPNDFKEFVASLLEHKNYPSKEEYLKKMKISAQQKQYTTEFDVKKFLEVIPNPEAFFKNHTSKRNYVDQDYALTFLKNQYCHLTIKDISTIFRECDNSIVKASVMLDKLKKTMKSKRRLYPLTNCMNIPLLQEIAYVKHKAQILDYMKMQEQEKLQNREFAKKGGLLKTCECCYDDEVMPEEMACCDDGHVFCKECVKKGCEVKIGEGKLDFPCLTTCEARFCLQVLQTVLTPKVFSKMAQRKQLEEVKSAGIEELEFCPFCDFATIPAPGDKLFRCLNTDCMKESCRECKEPSHIPLRCDEVEKENDVKLRTYIEDKMTEALVRKCYKCGMKFIKEEGCNKMTCSCGAMMCYVCNQPVKDYKHFNGQGGDQFHLCPLYSDTHKLHMDAVKLSAENAKKELGIANNQLKIDPTANLDQHYKRLANRNPQNLPPGMEQLNPQHIHIRIQEFHLARR